MCVWEQIDDLGLPLQQLVNWHTTNYVIVCAVKLHSVTWLCNHSIYMRINHIGMWVYNRNINTINDMTLNVNIPLTGGPTGPGRPFNPFRPYIEKNIIQKVVNRCIAVHTGICVTKGHISIGAAAGPILTTRGQYSQGAVVMESDFHEMSCHPIYLIQIF